MSVYLSACPRALHLWSDVLFRTTVWADALLLWCCKTVKLHQLGEFKFLVVRFFLEFFFVCLIFYFLCVCVRTTVQVCVECGLRFTLRRCQFLWWNFMLTRRFYCAHAGTLATRGGTCLVHPCLDVLVHPIHKSLEKMYSQCHENLNGNYIQRRKYNSPQMVVSTAFLRSTSHCVNRVWSIFNNV